MNEAETRAGSIDPALRGADWGLVEGARILRECSITRGRLEGLGHLHVQKLPALEVLNYLPLHQAFHGNL